MKSAYVASIPTAVRQREFALRKKLYINQYALLATMMSEERLKMLEDKSEQWGSLNPWLVQSTL